MKTILKSYISLLKGKIKNALNAVDQTIAGAFSGEYAVASPKGSLSQAKGQKGNKTSYFFS